MDHFQDTTILRHLDMEGIFTILHLHPCLDLLYCRTCDHESLTDVGGEHLLTRSRVRVLKGVKT